MAGSEAIDDGAVTPQWGDPWPPLRARLTEVLWAQPFLVELIWRIEPGRGADPLLVFHRMVEVELDLLLLCFDNVTHQILQLAAATDLLTRDRLLAEAAALADREIDLRVRQLHTMGLIDVEDDSLRLRLEIAHRIPLALPSFRSRLDSVTSDRLKIACRLLGVEAGSTKYERAEAILGVLSDPERLTRAVASCGPDAALVFMRVAERSWASRRRPADADDHVPTGALQPWELDVPRSMIVSSHASIGGSGVGRSALDLLADRCLVGLTNWGNVTWMWLEAHLALTGSMFDDWALPSVPATRAIDEPVGVAFRVVAQAEQMILRLASDAPEGKKSGDRRPPVKAIKNAATAAGVEAKLATLVVDAAIEMGVLMAVDLPQRGKGRLTERPVGWVLNPDRYAEWSHLLPEARWLSLVLSWMTVHGDFNPAAWLASIRRTMLLGRLADLPLGQGVRAAELSDWLHQCHPICGADIDDSVADLVRLGVVSSGTTVGLSGAGRAALSEHVASAEVPAALGEFFASGETSFVVQPDHTIIASADLAPELVRILIQIAEVESEGGAVVWRLTVPRLAAAAGSLDAATVVEFLRSNSSVPLTDNVARFVEDHLVVATPVTLGESFSHLITDDPVLFSRAVTVKPAKLTPLATTVAVSPLSPGKLREALVASGVAVRFDAATGAAMTAREVDGPLVGSWQVSQRPADRLLDTPVPIPLGDRVVESIVTHLDPSGAR